MIETTGATRHIYTAAAVAVRHEMTPDTLASRQYDTAVGQKGKKKRRCAVKKTAQQPTFSPGSLHAAL